MNTDKLIPISYVKQFTPLVKGDVVMSKSGKEYVVNSPKTWLIGMAKDWYLVSFAARPNTGTQPVDDDVVIDCVYDSKTGTDIANEFFFGNGDPEASCLTSWKLNHAALLAKYQSEQGANTMNTHKETAHHIALQIEELGNQPQHHIDLAIGAGAINDVVISPDEPVIEPWVGDHITCPGKPVFTQEMAKQRQAAPIGSSVQTSMGEGVVVAHGVSYGRSQVVIQTKVTMLSLDDSQYCPIDDRSDEDKIRDVILSILEMPPGVNSIIDNLLSSKKLSITLKE